jgi:protein-S-isoprenylcysteine O-methyltransferase Ste14
VLGALGFIAFVPIEERQLLRRRGDEYRAYMAETRYRIFRGIW